MKILPFALLAAALLVNHPSLAQTESAPVRPAAPAASSPEPKAGPSGLKPGMGAMAVAPATPSTRQITVASLTEKEIKGQDGSDLGEINRVVESTADKKTYVVVNRGGILRLLWNGIPGARRPDRYHWGGNRREEHDAETA